MSDTGYSEKVDSIFKHFMSAWIDGRAATIVGYNPPMYWVGNEKKPDSNTYWVRISQQTVIEPQRTLAQPGCRRFETAGLVFVQIFCPRVPSGMEKGRLLATIARNAFRGQKTTRNVVFNNARINELEPEADYYRFNVVAEYEYDELA